MLWANVGVGKLYRAYEVRLSLRNAQDEEVATSVVDADPREWLHGERSVTATMPLPDDLAAGEYTLKVGIMDKAGQRPPLHLAMDAPEQDGWYTVGAVTVKERTPRDGDLPAARQDRGDDGVER
jgi:hypothetical protein